MMNIKSTWLIVAVIFLLAFWSFSLFSITLSPTSSTTTSLTTTHHNQNNQFMDTNSLATLARVHGKDHPLIIMATDHKFFDMFLNALITLRDFVDLSHLVVVCQDQTTCDLVKPLGLITHYDSVIVDWGKAAFLNRFQKMNVCPEINQQRNVMELAGVMLSRELYLAQLLDAGHDFLEFDSDVCFLRNPLELFFPQVSSPDQRPDIVIAYHEIDYNNAFVEAHVFNETKRGTLNTGIMAWRAATRTRNFHVEVLGDMTAHYCEYGFSQTCFNRMMHEYDLKLHRLPGGGLEGVQHSGPYNLRLRTVPAWAQATWCDIDEGGQDYRTKDKAYYAHAACPRGDKRDFLRELKCWHLNPEWRKFDRSMGWRKYLDAIDLRINNATSTSTAPSS